MPTVAGIASTFTLPNYIGPLFMLTPQDNMFSGLVGFNADGGGRVELNYEFGINAEELPAPSQPAILEGADIATPSEISMTHSKNVTQIFNESFGLTYSRTASVGRIASDSTHTAGAQGAVNDPFEHQAMLKMAKIRRDLNYTFINGVYNNPANPTTHARKTRGILAAVDSGNVVSAGGAELNKDVIQELLRTMWENGALTTMDNVYIFVRAFNKQRISDIYGYAPQDRNVGGVNIQTIETDFGRIGIVLERDMPADTLLVANLSVVEPVFNVVVDPETGSTLGVLFRRPVPQTKTTFQDQIYGEIGLDHGPGLWHGKITDLATEPIAE